MRTVSQSRLHHITGSRTPREQAAVLRQIGVLPLVRADGSLCVFEEVLRDAMIVKRQDEHEQPRWEALDAPAKRRA